MPKAQVVIALDMDGVLISTAGALYRIFDEFTAKYGGRATTELFEFYNGKKIVEVVRDLSVRFKYTQSEEHLLADYFSRIEEIYKTCELQAGALEFLKYCRQSNIPVCLATGANRSVAETVLESTKTSSYFDFTVCADDVQNGKPSPEMYLKIKDRFPADLYIAVDDADNGIQGARAAGMKAYLFGPNGAGDESVVDSFSQLIKALSAERLRLTPQTLASSFILEVESVATGSSTEATDRFDQLKKKNPKLHNGELLRLHSFVASGDEFKAIASRSNYATYLFERAENQRSNFISLGVSAVVIQGDRALVGRRADHVSSYPGQLEFVGSGTLMPDQSIADMLFAELEEEVGLKRADILSFEPVVVLYDEKLNCVDFCYAVKAAPGFVPMSQSDEYSEVEFVEYSKLSERLSSSAVPTSISLIDLCRNFL